MDTAPFQRLRAVFHVHGELAPEKTLRVPKDRDFVGWSLTPSGPCLHPTGSNQIYVSGIPLPRKSLDTPLFEDALLAHLLLAAGTRVLHLAGAYDMFMSRRLGLCHVACHPEMVGELAGLLGASHIEVGGETIVPSGFVPHGILVATAHPPWVGSVAQRSPTDSRTDWYEFFACITNPNAVAIVDMRGVR